MKKIIPIKIQLKRFRRRITSKKKRKYKRKSFLNNKISLRKKLGKDTSYDNQLKEWLPKSVHYFMSQVKVDRYESLKLTKRNELIIEIPKNFSLDSNLILSLSFIKTLIGSILLDDFKAVLIDYSKCKKIDLNAQICLDALLLDTLRFLKQREKFIKTIPKINSVGGGNIKNDEVKKILFSIGSPAVFNKKSHDFEDIIPYHLCIHNKDKDSLRNSERKELDTTRLIQHVESSLNLIGKELTQDAIEDLSTVIGEILINAEEHSSLNKRYSTGYFQKFDDANLSNSYGIYHLVILNFGQSIYEVFKSPDCLNPDNVKKMERLSKKYTEKDFFNSSFPEESLWTLYSLQEGITSTSPDDFKKRGNGSIRFIESFFNLRSVYGKDHISLMNIISGNTSIIFDGTYEIENKKIGDENFKVMTFNRSGNIEDKPDTKYVRRNEAFFPGTIITAKILITKDDIL